MTSSATCQIRRMIESWYPLVVALIVFVVSSYQEYLTLEGCQKLSSQYLSVFTAFLGFAFASMVTLVCLADKEFLRGMKQSGALPLLLRYHWNCLVWCVVAIGTALTIQFCSVNNFYPTFGAILMATGVGAILATWRIARLFHRLLRILGFI